MNLRIIRASDDSEVARPRRDMPYGVMAAAIVSLDDAPPLPPNQADEFFAEFFNRPILSQPTATRLLERTLRDFQLPKR